MGTSLSVVPGLDEYVGGANADLGLAGQHQRINAALAVSLAAAWEARHAQVGCAHMAHCNAPRPGWHVLTPTLGDGSRRMLIAWCSSTDVPDELASRQCSQQEIAFWLIVD